MLFRSSSPDKNFRAPAPAFPLPPFGGMPRRSSRPDSDDSLSQSEECSEEEELEVSPDFFFFDRVRVTVRVTAERIFANITSH